MCFWADLRATRKSQPGLGTGSRWERASVDRWSGRVCFWAEMQREASREPQSELSEETPQSKYQSSDKTGLGRVEREETKPKLE